VDADEILHWAYPVRPAGVVSGQQGLHAHLTLIQIDIIFNNCYLFRASYPHPLRTFPTYAQGASGDCHQNAPMGQRQSYGLFDVGQLHFCTMLPRGNSPGSTQHDDIATMPLSMQGAVNQVRDDLAKNRGRMRTEECACLCSLHTFAQKPAQLLSIGQ